MKLVIDDPEATRLQHRMEQQGAYRAVQFYDTVLDDGTWLLDTITVDDSAFALRIGGHTGLCYLSAYSERLAGRVIRHSLRLRRWHTVILLGWWLRRRWARSVGASLTFPEWRPRI